MHTNLGNVQWLLSRTQSLAIFLLSSASFVHVQTRAHKSPITTAYTCSCVPRVSGTDGATVVSGKRQEEPQTLACGADVTEVDKRWCRLDVLTSISHNYVVCLLVVGGGGGGLEAEQLRMLKNETK